MSDDTNVWVNNASKKRAAEGNVMGDTPAASSVKGMKRVQSLLGMLQQVILRNSDAGIGQVLQVHSPCQLLPRANSWTILCRLRRWGLFTSQGCPEQFGGRGLWDLFAAVPLKLVIHCRGLSLNSQLFRQFPAFGVVAMATASKSSSRQWSVVTCRLGGDALPANHVVQAAEHADWHKQRAAGDVNALTTLQTELNCMHHQAALALKPGLLSVPNLCSSMVRMTLAMRSARFQSLFQDGMEAIAKAVDRRVVVTLPSSVEAIQENHRFLLGLLGCDLKPEEADFVLDTFNSSWDDEFSDSLTWVHWCKGCCTNDAASVERAREALRILFKSFPQVPLLYRWKGWGPVQNYATRGVFIHNFLAYLITSCCSKNVIQKTVAATMDEDSPDLSYALRQEVRMGKTLAFITSDSIRVA